MSKKGEEGVNMKRGIFGGSFNPPQKDHFAIAEGLLEKKIVDEVIFVPVGNYYPKSNLIAGVQRIEMLECFTKKFSKMKVSQIEVVSNKRMYTYQTLAEIQKEYPFDQLYFILGADLLLEFKTWNHYREILDRYYFIVIPRDNLPVQQFLNTEFPKYCYKFIIWNAIGMLSSTMVRKLIFLQQPYDEYVDSEVYKYIEDNKLYRKKVI